MLSYFLLSYSVIPQSDYSGDIEKANKVRRTIGELKQWDKSENNETTFMGIITIEGDSNDSRMKSSIREIEEVFKPILKQYDASSGDVVIYCSMMVEGIDKYFEFDVSR
ncbi:TPA: hypothetical protein QCI09_004707 [Enterobacter ludwigii]|uniref:hypothetical protein n=1 Tax=Enterobacter ludwigii TaxID=299767 RepID=UPI001C8BA78D|nr:hypothetical protein [Enterobacter ludwigii]MBX8877369.1 hypothetical protein [Enterobacter ludwigii]HDR2560623.1 hypothetical protein [Enterobacter ludwigii]HDR2581294.1 hypothetical protein [Enterobacter ludwigii]